MGGGSPGPGMMQRAPMQPYVGLRPGMPPTPSGVKRPVDSRVMMPQQPKKYGFLNYLLINCAHADFYAAKKRKN